MRKVAVTGGSGQLGALIVRRLLDQPDIDAVVCIDLQPPRLASAKLAFVELDVRDERLAHHLSGCFALVHCAFLVTSNAPDTVFRSVNIDGSKNVFRAAAAAGVEHIVHLSSMLAYGSVAGHPVPIVEDTPRIHQRDFPYAACKHEVEAFLDEFEPAHPAIAVCRLRPAVLLGRNMPHALGSLLRGGWVPWQGGAPLTIVYDEDVADLVVLALAKRARGAFNAAADDLMTPEDVAERFNMYVLKLPDFVVAGYRGLDWCLNQVGLHLAFETAWHTKTQGVALVLSSARARAELGWSPRCPTTAAVFTQFLEVAPRRLDRRLAATLALLRRQGRRPAPAFAGRSAEVHLCITGEYGGDYSLVLTDGRIAIQWLPPPFPTGAIRVPAPVLLAMLAGEVDASDAQRRSDLAFEGNGDGPLMLDWMVAAAADLRAGKGIRSAVARALLRPRRP